MSPRFHSKDGVWHPAKEKVGLTDHEGTKGRSPGDPYVYKGPDRAALYELYKAKVETLGQDFRHDPDLVSRIRSLGYKDIDEYAKSVGYDEKKVEENFKKNASVVVKHELPEPKEGIKPVTGGADFSGQGQDREGGFGELPNK